MDTTVFEIAARNQAAPVALRQPDQFIPKNEVRTDPEIVLGPQWSLYCLDIANHRGLFVELPAEVDLSAAPFVYGAQFDHAIRAASVPLDILPDLAAQVPEPANVALLMSTGRCGSTLASRIFAQIPGVRSLSEPDWFTNLAMARFDMTTAETESLIAACTRLTCRPPAGTEPEVYILKPRSEMMVQAAAYVSALKGAHAVFLYRDCFGYVNSLYRFVQRIWDGVLPVPGTENWAVMRHIATINGTEKMLADHFNENEEITASDMMTLSWAIRMRAYLEASDNGMGVAPIHYSDLSADREAQTAVLLETCGIDIGHLDVALKGFEKDAHAGSAGENAVPAAPISAAQRERVAVLVERWGMSDYVTDRLAPIGLSASK